MLIMGATLRLMSRGYFYKHLWVIRGRHIVWGQLETPVFRISKTRGNSQCSPKNKVAKFMIVLHIPDIRAIRLFVSFVIPYANFITNYAFGQITRILTGYFLASPQHQTQIDNTFKTTPTPWWRGSLDCTGTVGKNAGDGGAKCAPPQHPRIAQAHMKHEKWGL